MRTRDFGWTTDLAVIVAWTLAAAGAVLIGVSGPLRVVLGVPTVVLFPGYAVVAALYPGRQDAGHQSFDAAERSIDRAFSRTDALSGVERLMLSALLSVVAVPAIVLAVDLSPWRISVVPVTAGVVAFTVGFAALALGARLRVPAEARYRPPLPALSAVTFESNAPSLGEGRRAPLWSAALVISLVLVASSVGYAFVNPPRSPSFTELYLQPGGVTNETTSLYPSTFTRGRAKNLTFAVANHEHRRVRYGYAVLLQRVDGRGENATVREETALAAGRLAVPDNGTRNVTVAARPNTTGTDLRIVVLLYRGELPAHPASDSAYRELRLPITVRSAGSGSAGVTAPTSLASDAPAPTLVVDASDSTLAVDAAASPSLAPDAGASPSPTAAAGGVSVDPAGA
ncbi:MAG: DUF1616 domain-containing protein [Salinigranum sp.]